MIFLAGGFNAGGIGPCYVFASWVAVEREGAHNVRYEASGHGSGGLFQGMDGRANSISCPERVCVHVSCDRQSEYLMLLE